MSPLDARSARRHRGGHGISTFAAGVIGLVVIAIGCYLGFTKRLPFQGRYEIEAVVASTNSLKSNTTIRIAGVNVGKVVKIERGPGSTGIVTMAIDKRGRPIYKDATLKIRPRTFLEGNFFVDLKPGTNRAPELGDGDVIPLAQTAIPVQLDQVLTNLDAPTRQSLKDVLQEYGATLRGGGAEAIRRSFPDWAPAFRNTALTMEALRGREADDLSTLIAASARVTTAIANERPAFQQLLSSFATSVGALASRQAQVGQTIRGLDATVAGAHPALGSLNAAIPSVRTFTAEARPSLRRLPRTLDLAQPVLEQLDGALDDRELPGLVRDLRPAVRSLIRIEPRLVGLVRNVEPVTECVRENALPVLKDTIKDGALSTGQPVWQELLHLFPNLASAGSNFDGNGGWIRYYAGVNESTLALGQIPGATDLLRVLSPEPISGTRPAPPAKVPPFRPDVPCRGQKVADLDDARTGAPPSDQRTIKPSANPVELPGSTVKRLRGTLRDAAEAVR